jgi:hypothetical protein
MDPNLIGDVMIVAGILILCWALSLPIAATLRGRQDARRAATHPVDASTS